MLRKLLLAVLVLVVIAGALVAVGSARAGDSPASHAHLLDQLDELARLLQEQDLQAQEVSDWSVHRHVEHLLQANRGILGMIAAGQAPETVEPKTLLGRVVLWTGHIPRGKGQAPASTVPEGRDTAELAALCAEVATTARALDLDDLPAGVVGNHPVFGGFTAPDWLRLMDVHDAHHLAIVADIRDARRGAE